MRLHVAFLPSLVLPRPSGATRRKHVCVVVDVIRASTTLVTMVEQGARQVFIAGDVASARRAAAAHEGALLAGETEGLAPSGFDYGNSPVELSRVPLAGKMVVFVTTNGTAAIRAVRDADSMLVGALRNGAAVSREAWEAAAALGGDLTIVCAGREGGFGVDDAYCAGYLVQCLVQMGTPDLTDAAAAAARLYGSEPDAPALFSQSAAGRNVIRLGLTADVPFCAARDASEVVPRLGREIFLLEEP